MKVYPTHTCFDDSLDLLVELLQRNPSRQHSLRLVHGICRQKGQDSAHAWVEDTGSDRVIFVGIVRGRRATLVAPREEYYRELNVQESTKYTPRQALNENLRTNNFGPWIERYQKLCVNRPF